MCLREVTKVINEPTSEIVNGRKVFIRGVEPPISLYPECQLVDAYESSGWISSGTGEIYHGRGQGYREGFHAFSAKKGVEDWAFIPLAYKEEIHRVQLRYVRTIGVQSDHRCIVADKMRIPAACLKGTCKCYPGNYREGK